MFQDKVYLQRYLSYLVIMANYVKKTVFVKDD